ncbi:MAG: DEAD/DEAH box helicase [Byssovorax sp.]
MKRPGSPVDPTIAAMLRQFIAQPKSNTPVRRPEPPPAARRELRYVLSLPSAFDKGNPWVAVEERFHPPGEKPSRWARMPVSEAHAATAADPDDRMLLAALRDLLGSTASYAQREVTERGSPERFQLSRAGRDRLLPAMARTGRLLLAGPELGVTTTLTWTEEPWALRLRVELRDTGAAEPTWAVIGQVRLGDRTVPLAELTAMFEGGLAIAQGMLGQVDDGGASSWLGLLRQHRQVVIPPARRAAFLEELFTLPSPPPLDLPPGLALREVTAEARPKLQIHAPTLAEGPRGPLLHASLHVDYGGVLVPAERPGKVAFDGGRMALVRRDPAAEEAARTRLASLGLESVPRGTAGVPEGAHLKLAATRLPLVVSTLLAEGFTVDAAGKVYRRSTGSDLFVKSSGVDWFDLGGSLRFDGFRVPLPDVLAALRRGDSTVVLDDGTLGVLPEDWLRKHGLLLGLGEAKKKTIRFLPSQVPLLDTLVRACEAKVDAAFTEARERLGEGGPLGPAEPPAGFTGELRGYQKEGLAWLGSLDRAGFGGCLADDMGLGKTVQVLALLAGRRSGKPSLVVAPRSLLFNWKREAARFAPDLRVLEHTGQDRKPPGEHFARFDLVLTTYGTMRRDVEALSTVALDYLVLDEAQAIKNATSDTAKAARSLTAARRLALSGTPIENHLGELWSLFGFLNPGLLGKASAFEAATRDPTPETVSVLAKAVRPFLLRRTKAEVAPDLPERLEETWVCELGPKERDFYDELRHHYRNELLRKVSREGMGAARVHVLEALLRLRQAACHPGLVDPKRKHEPSAKLSALVPRLVELREAGQKALVFSQFTSLLALLAPLLRAEGIAFEELDGSTRDREARVDRFQRDAECGVFLISLKAGGVGLNLTAAEYVFLLDPWWNPASEAQAVDRAHRIGQRRSVFAYRLLSKDTVEERIAELKRQKQALAESVIRGERGPLSELSADDLDRLLS